MVWKTWIGAGVVTALSMAASTALWAQDAALVIGNRDYNNGQPVQQADEVFDAVFALRSAGFEVLSGRDTSRNRLNRLVDDFSDLAPEADRVVILLAGHIVEGRRDSYFLPVNANTRSTGRLARSAVSLGALMDIAATKPGGAVIALATDPEAPHDLGSGMTLGLGDLPVPQGVTLVTGVPQQVTDFVELLAEEPGISVPDALAHAGGDTLAVQGYQTALHGFLPAEGPHLSPDGIKEEGFWSAAKMIGTQNALNAYLNSYPNGAYRNEAEDLLEDLRDAPRREAEAAERALALSRDDRRAVQRMLTLLGYNTRGIDGIFGRGTRGSIRQWQTDNDVEATGYLTRGMIRTLTEQARDRNAELEAEAAEQARAEARREDALWRRVRREDTMDAYRQYLDRYPDGTYAEAAQNRLRRLDRAARRFAQAEEREAWDAAALEGSAESYREYLSEYPNGVFAHEANARLRLIEQEAESEAAQQAAAREEAQVIGNPIMRLLTERRLDALGLEPGRVDGQFDEHTRRAIRKYQRARGLPVSGYVTQDTAVRMLAEAVR